MSNMLIRGAKLNQPVMLRREHFFDAGSRAICLTESDNGEDFMYLIKNDMGANQDGFFILSGEDLDFFDEAPLKNFFNDEFNGLEIKTNKYYACEDGSLNVNESYNLYFTYNGKYVAKWTVDHEDDQPVISKVYNDDNFKSEFEFFLESKNQSSKEMFYKNAINLKWELDHEEIEKSFTNYISDFGINLRTFEEHIAHDYIRLNNLKPDMLQRFNFIDDLIHENVRFNNFQTGVMFKVMSDMETSHDRSVKKGDFYQIVKKWNSDYYLELLNVDGDVTYNGKRRALVLNCDKETLVSNFRNVLDFEREALYHSNVIRGLEIGEEVEFSYDLQRKTLNSDSVSIKKGMIGTVIKSDYKIRLAIKDEDSKEVLYRDFYRTEILNVTKLKNKINEWMVIPAEIKREDQSIWNNNREVKESRLYHNGRSVAILSKTNNLMFFNELIEQKYQSLKSNLLSSLSEETKNMTDKEKNLVIMHHLIGLPDITKKINKSQFNAYNKKIKQEKNMKLN